MKKITLFAGAALLSVSAFSQSLTSEAEGTPSVLERNPDAILWDQPNDPDGTGGIVSTLNNANVLVISADDFIFNETNEIETVFVSGFNNAGNMVTDLQTLNLYIYAQDEFLDVPASDPSQPGTGLLEIVELDRNDPAVTETVDGGLFFSYEIDIAAATGSTLVLPAGTYWLAFAPRINIPDFGGTTRWNWSQGLEGAPGTSEAHLIDVDDVFGGGFTSWTAFSSLGVAWSALEFRIEGETLSTEDNLLSFVSVYPNPTSDILNLKIPASLEITNVNLFDLLGKNTGVSLSNNTIDISSLSKGVYLLSIETNQGSLTQKVVKK